MKWTGELPAKSGYYWMTNVDHKGREGKEIVKVRGIGSMPLIIRMMGDGGALFYGGVPWWTLFYGPLKSPPLPGSESVLYVVKEEVEGTLEHPDPGFAAAYPQETMEGICPVCQDGYRYQKGYPAFRCYDCGASLDPWDAKPVPHVQAPEESD